MTTSSAQAPVRIGVRELRANLSGVLRQARDGISILVMSRNQVVAEIHPPTKIGRPPRQPGLLKGKIKMADDFDDLPPDILAAIEGD